MALLSLMTQILQGHVEGPLKAGDSSPQTLELPEQQRQKGEKSLHSLGLPQYLCSACCMKVLSSPRLGFRA